MIGVFDYGAGNLRSVQNTLGEIGATYQLIDDADGLRTATKIILPGVGHFGQIMRSLNAMRVRETLIARMQARVPFLGICLGLQALFEGSEEAPDLPGLGVFPGRIRRFQGAARVPHMGWNEIDQRQPDSRILRGLGPKPYLYFAHSYYAPLNEATAASCTYATPYTAVLERANLFGVQFHPEKSGPLGLQIVRNFVELDAC
ncbi:MAG: imidazole glycerol phosphate synthase subunit HisH [Acidobacteria bacterium]|nr:imidazole glycerol phosphate synthase subunit HisH [Acidobacteriota bacterium]